MSRNGCGTTITLHGALGLRVSKRYPHPDTLPHRPPFARGLRRLGTETDQISRASPQPRNEAIADASSATSTLVAITGLALAGWIAHWPAAGAALLIGLALVVGELTTLAVLDLPLP